MENRKIIPFPVTFRQPDVFDRVAKENCRNVDNAAKTAKILPFPSAAKLPSKQMESHQKRAPPYSGGGSFVLLAGVLGGYFTGISWP